MRKIFLIIAFTIISFFAQSQATFLTKPSKIIDESEKFMCPTSVIDWDNLTKSKNSNYNFAFTSPSAFTCFGVGFGTESINVKCIDLSIKYRLKKDGEKQTQWKRVEFETSSNQTITNLFGSELIFTPDGTPYNDVEIEIICPTNVNANKIRITLMDISKSVKIRKEQNETQLKTTTCPAMPTIIPRSSWLDPYYTQPYYTSTITHPTHAVIHHGASPDTYTDGAAVVRSYWNYHVNSNGWSDIGYNYLLDKYGNIYQGRQNSSIATQDVNGAHAGASNPYSIGINFLGNADVTLPTAVQLETLYDFLGWWFTDRGYSPTTSASIVLQSGGSATLPRICGHKDVNIGGTTCPGTTLYALLSSIRTETQAVINACTNQNVSTAVNVNSNWQSTNFTATFTDEADAGVAESFYQVLDFDNTEWRANFDFGFFNDNFDNAIHTDWTNSVGTWSIVSGKLNQADEVNSNTNIYSSVNQESGNVYLYQFSMKINGTGTNKRAGLHFFCDDASASNRNNSYMVYFRADGDKCQIYKYVNDVYTLETDDICVVNEDTWYNYQITFNTTTGEIKAFKDGVLVSSWTDSSPYTSGNAISLRTGECNATFEDLKVLKNRGTTETITVGNAQSEARYQNITPTAAACRIKSIIIDSNNNWSNLEGVNVNIDWTQPLQVSVNDGFSADIDTSYNNTTLSANWTSSIDANSDIASYKYCIGNTAGAGDITAWTDNGLSTNVTVNSLSLTYGNTYYFSVKAVNNASLESNIISSDGVLLYQLGAPTTSISTVGNWQTQNFTANFSDASDVSINTSFYQVLDYSNSEWRANSDFGFFNDNFNSAIHSDWTNSTGIWAINSGVINQSDENDGNSNIYASVNQEVGGVFLYSFKMKISGTGINKRAGIHFFSDDASASNRNNSYMVYFRADGNKCQIYKYTNNVYELETDDTCVVDENTWYNYKIMFNTISGEITAFQNDELVSSWIDANPFTSGDYVSLRTGNCNVDYDDVSVFKSRTSSQFISIGNTNAEVRFQNENPTSAACKINSIIFDNAEQWSAIANSDINIDWTNPSSTTINDGLSTDIDATDDNTELSANWTNSIDGNSDIAYYQYCIGTAAGASNTLNWTNNGINTSITVGSLSLIYGNTYFVSVKSVNNAGLETINSSDGIYINELVVSDSVIAIFHAIDTLLDLPNASAVFVNTSVNADSYTWDFGDGTTSTDANPWHQYYTSGVFTVSLIGHSTTLDDDTLTLTNYIHVSPAQTSVEANFYATDTVLQLPNAIAVFVNTSVNANSYIWNFGDGTSSSDVNPTHQYNVAGEFTVSLIAHSTTLGNDTLTMINYIQVNANEEVVEPNFYALDTLVNLGSSVAFVNTSNNADSYTWNFGDGTTSTDNNPWHIYANAGYYSVSLTAHSTILDDATLTKANYIHVVNIDNINLLDNENIITIYPNPANNYIFVDGISDFNIKNIEIYDITGKLMIVKELKNKEIYISDFAKGIYFLKAVKGDKIFVGKYVKE